MSIKCSKTCSIGIILPVANNSCLMREGFKKNTNQGKQPVVNPDKCKWANARI